MISNFLNMFSLCLCGYFRFWFCLSVEQTLNQPRRFVPRFFFQMNAKQPGTQQHKQSHDPRTRQGKDLRLNDQWTCMGCGVGFGLLSDLNGLFMIIPFWTSDWWTRNSKHRSSPKSATLKQVLKGLKQQQSLRSLTQAYTQNTPMMLQSNTGQALLMWTSRPAAQWTLFSLITTTFRK